MVTFFLSLNLLHRKEGKEGGEGGKEVTTPPYSRGMPYINHLEFSCLWVLFSTSLSSHVFISGLIHGHSIYTLFSHLALCYLFHCAACPSVIFREAPASLWHELTFADVQALCLQGVYDHQDLRSTRQDPESPRRPGCSSACEGLSRLASSRWEVFWGVHQRRLRR